MNSEEKATTLIIQLSLNSKRTPLLARMFTDDNDDDQYLPIDDTTELFYQMQGRKFSTLNKSYLLPVDEDEFKVSKPDWQHPQMIYV